MEIPNQYVVTSNITLQRHAMNHAIDLTLKLELNDILPNITDEVASALKAKFKQLDAVTVSLETETNKLAALDSVIARFNNMYDLPAPDSPTTRSKNAKEMAAILSNFKNILQEEVDELDEIINKLEANSPVENLAEVCDWLGDIIVYCASELTKYGIPPSNVLSIIMASNMSKLGKDGNAIKDERGKVLKGPDYWHPEPEIIKLIHLLAREKARKERQ